MKPSNFKGTAMPTYALMIQVKILGQVKLCTGMGQSS